MPSFRQNNYLHFLMKNTAKTPAEELYRLFGSYPFPAGMQGCPCCVADEHLRLLRSKPLRQLGSAELDRYVFKAMTTWGTTQDFKYYLPRLLEVYVSGGQGMELSLILDKLNYAGWRSWPEDEQGLIRAFFLDWWHVVINQYTCRLSILDDLHVFLYEEDLLSYWNLNVQEQGFRNFVNMAYGCYNDPRYYWARDWIQEQAARLHEAFFYFETCDPPLAKRISDTLYTIEHS